MGIVLIRTLILYVIVIFGMRFMGKRQIGELSPAELVIAIMISEVGAVPMQSIDIPLLYGVISIIVLVTAEIIVSSISLKSGSFRGFMNGRPVAVIERGKILQSQMRKLRMSIDDLYEEIRQKDLSHLCDVYFAIVETNGKLSLMPNDPNNLSPSSNGYEYPIVKDGRISEKGLQISKKNIEFVKQKLAENKVSSVRDVFLMSIDDKDNIYIILKSDD
ncbi:MAG: DUF421 domain-containing protein [Bacillota bacterium]|nr:DUF421 domain-containing protein [Bacillota bacterium]